MATQLNLLQGEVRNDSEIDSHDIERLLLGFLRTLLDEQKGEAKAETAPDTGSNG